MGCDVTLGLANFSEAVVIVPQISCGLLQAPATTKNNTMRLNENMACVLLGLFSTQSLTFELMILSHKVTWPLWSCTTYWKSFEIHLMKAFP